MSSHRKVKDPNKIVIPRGDKLTKKVLDTMSTISSIVGSTLGPGGSPVLLERQDYGFPNLITKDGVTVFNYLGFEDPTSQAIMESARDAATKTVSEAGDGTTTATVLAEAIVRYANGFCKDNPRVSPQKIVSKLEKVFKEYIEPRVKELSLKPDLSMLKDVAKISANGDAELADVVMKCFDIVGDDGNIAIIEQSGPSGYDIEELKGFPIHSGYEDSCGKFFNMFLNDRANNRCLLEKPVFVLYFGAITEIQTILMLMEKIGLAWQERKFNHNVVVAATGFSESVLGNLGKNFMHPQCINVVPLLVPKFPTENGQLNFLMDLSAVTGAKIFDPITNPIEKAELEDLSYGNGVDSFEMTRYRSTIMGLADEGLIIAQAEEVKKALQQAESKFDKLMTQERLGNLTNGIARLIIKGPSSGELREKRDRAEDASFAVRGAKKHGCLPGGCWTLLKLYREMQNDEDPIVRKVLCNAFLEPIRRILQNCGYNHEEQETIINKYNTYSDTTVFNAMEGEFTDALKDGILDSVPAVLEAIRNSISIAGLLGTLGGLIVFDRDAELERKEAMSAMDYMRSITE